MYGILVVEDGNGIYQIIGEVASRSEAEEMALDYERAAEPENQDTFCPPSEYVIWRRNRNGYYAEREPFTLAENTTAARLNHLEKLARSIPMNSAILSGIQECRDRLNGKE